MLVSVSLQYISGLKPIFLLATFFARREAKAGIEQRDWLKLAREKIRREQVGSVPTFLSVRANKFAKWKIGFTRKRKHMFWRRFFQMNQNFCVPCSCTILNQMCFHVSGKQA